MTSRLIAVGVAKYADDQVQPLPPCDSEATEVANALTGPTGAFSAPESVVLRSGDEDGKKATRANVLHQLGRLSFFSQPSDALCFYFSGHGASKNGEGFLFCQDSYDNNLEETGLAISKLATLLSKASARYKIGILDCCRPGRLIGKPATSGMDADFSAAIEKDIPALQDAGMVIVTSCSADQVSHLLPDGSGSVFTSFFLESLRSNPPGEGEFITLQDTYDYALTKCREWSFTNNKQQVPRIVVDGVGGGATSIGLAKRISSPVVIAPPSPETRVGAAAFALRTSRTLVFPREVIPAPQSPYSALSIVGFGPQVEYGGVDRERASEIRAQAKEIGRGWLETTSASLLRFYPPETLVREETDEVSYPDGNLTIDSTDTAGECFVELLLRVRPSAKSGELLDHLQDSFGWQEFHVFLGANKVSLASVAAHARKVGWNIPRFSPEQSAEVRIKGWGKKSEPASVIFFQDGKTHALSTIVFKLETISSQNSLSSLVSEVTKMLSELSS